MTLQKFEVGKVYHTPALYGGELSIEILSRTDREITYRYTTECSDDHTEKVAEIIRQTAYDVETQEPCGKVESIEAWEYYPEGLPQEAPDICYFLASSTLVYRAGKLLAKHEEVVQYQIMYRNCKLPRARSAVIFSEEGNRLVEARFESREAAEKVAHLWFDKEPEIQFWVTKVDPGAKGAWRLVRVEEVAHGE